MSLEELRAVLVTLEDLLGQHHRRLDDLELAMVLDAFLPGTGPAGPPTDGDLVGSPAAMAERVRQYAALGIRHVLLHAQPRDWPPRWPRQWSFSPARCARRSPADPNRWWSETASRRRRGPPRFYAKSGAWYPLTPRGRRGR